MLAEIARVHCSVCFSLSTTDDALARKVEPFAPPPSARLAAMRALAERGVAVGTCMMPILPFLEDNPENIHAIVEQTAAHGGGFIIPWFGMSMRDRQREYYYAELDRHFPGLREKYERRYGQRYECPANYAADLARQFYLRCAELGLETHVRRYQPARQMSLF